MRFLNKVSVQFSSVTQSCPTLCDPMNRSTPGLAVHHQLPEFTQTHVHRVSDAIQPSHPLSSPSPSAPNPSQHQSLFLWVNSSHEVAKYMLLLLLIIRLMGQDLRRELLALNHETEIVWEKAQTMPIILPWAHWPRWSSWHKPVNRATTPLYPLGMLYENVFSCSSPHQHLLVTKQVTHTYKRPCSEI